MNHADRVVVAEIRRADKHRAAGIDLHERESERLRDGRRRQLSGDYRSDEAQPVVGEQNLGRHHADLHGLVHLQSPAGKFDSGLKVPWRR
jgi:hypothetical protein